MSAEPHETRKMIKKEKSAPNTLPRKKKRKRKFTSSASSLRNTPTIRPTTPPRSSKKEFLADLWKNMHEMCLPMIQTEKTILDHDEKSPESVHESKESTSERGGPQSNKLLEKFRDEDKFRQMATFLRQKSTVECVAKWWAVINSFVLGTKLVKGSLDKEIRQARVILTALMVSKFPLEVLELDPDKLNANEDGLNQDSGLAENVYTHSLDVVNEVFRICPAIQTADNLGDLDSKGGILNRIRCDEIIKIIDDFSEALDCYKNHDRVKVLDSLKKYYRDWLASQAVLRQSSLNDTQRDGVFNVIENNLRSTREKMVRLIGKEQTRLVIEEILSTPDERRQKPLISKNKVDDTVNDSGNDESSSSYSAATPIQNGQSSSKNPSSSSTSTSSVPEGMIELNLDEIVREEGQKLYWKEFAGEIESQKYERLFAILNELLSRLRVISPESDLKYLNDLIDVDFIGHSISHGVLDAKSFYSIFNGIWTQIKRLHAPVHDTEWKSWHDSIISKMSDPSAQWHSIVPIVMNRFLCKMDEIEDAIKGFQPILKKTSKHKQK